MWSSRRGWLRKDGWISGRMGVGLLWMFMCMCFSIWLFLEIEHLNGCHYY